MLAEGLELVGAHAERRERIDLGAVDGPARPLHSGHYGNWAPNPAMMLARLLASMKDAGGTVTGTMQIHRWSNVTIAGGAVAGVDCDGPATQVELRGGTIAGPLDAGDGCTVWLFGDFEQGAGAIFNYQTALVALAGVDTTAFCARSSRSARGRSVISAKAVTPRFQIQR